MKKLITFLILISISVFAFSKPLKYRFPAGDVRNKLPNYLKKDGFYHPLKDARGNIVSEARLSELGILVLVPAIPDAGKIITKSHGEIINGQWLEIIDVQKTQAEIDAEILAAKITALNTCTKLELYEAMKTLEMLELFNSFKLIPEFEYENIFKFNHPIVVQAMTALDPAILQSIKEQIIKNREQ